MINQNYAITKCMYGHEFTPDNTIINKSNGKRSCRTCYNENSRVRRNETYIHTNGNFNREKTHCIHGHEFTRFNTITKIRGKDQLKKSRDCRECNKIRCRENYQKRKQVVLA